MVLVVASECIVDLGEGEESAGGRRGGVAGGLRGCVCRACHRS